MNIDSRRREVQAEASDRFRTAARPGSPQEALKNEESNPERMAKRTAIAESLSDTHLQERLLGESDLLPVSFLERGAAAARTVGRIDVRDEFGKVLGYGTGFLVGQDVLMTNNHVLSKIEDALCSRVTFDYEDDATGQPRAAVTFALEPSRLFVTDRALDYTFVAVRPTSLNGQSLSGFGYNVLIADSGKALLCEHINLVQHPRGGPKQVTVRDNHVLGYPGPFAHYQADSEPGASGCPVFNDQWYVVAIHHSSVARKNADGTKYLHRTTGNELPLDPFPDEDDLDFVANEGVCISAIAKHIAGLDLPEPQGPLVRSLFRPISEVLTSPQGGLIGPTSAPSTQPQVGTGTSAPPDLTLVERLSADKYADRQGYQVDFLGIDVPLPKVPDEDDVAPVEGRRDGLLNYTHFSVKVSKSRCIAWFTAANIDGASHVKIQRSKDRWYVDGRIDDAYQTGNALYAGNDLDRGHLVRREDPNWGEDAKQANEDTFHFTNCSPQHKALNQKTWLDLENHVLSTAQRKKIRVTVFTGPVFRDDDLEYRGLSIPAEFWKVVVTVDHGHLAAAAYLQSQRNMLGSLEFAFGKYKTWAVPLSRIEKLTRLNFGSLKKWDVAKKKRGPHEGAEADIREVIDVAAEF